MYSILDRGFHLLLIGTIGVEIISVVYFYRKFSNVDILMINPLYNEHDDVFVLDLVTNIGHLDVS